jgi:hypothetical protein
VEDAFSTAIFSQDYDWNGISKLNEIRTIE